MDLIIAAILAIIGGFALVAATRQLAGLHPLAALKRLLPGGVLVGAAALIALMGLNVRTYAPLPAINDVLRIGVQEVEPGLFDLQIVWAPLTDDIAPRRLELQTEGEVWRMQARILHPRSWAGWALDETLFRFDTLTGLDAGADAGLHRAPVERLSRRYGLDVWSLSRRVGRLVSPWRAAMPSQALQAPLIDGGEFLIVRNGAADLSVMAGNEAARLAMEAFENPEL